MILRSAVHNGMSYDLSNAVWKALTFSEFILELQWGTNGKTR
jgi:hypothetical protein